jgi:hypothetical protein
MNTLVHPDSILDLVVLVLGYLLVVFGGGWLVGRAIRGLAVPPEIVQGGIRNAGQYIGWLERFIITTLVLLNNLGAVGFVIAAKSIFRFGEIRRESDRSLAEYFLLGTLLSVAFALAVSLCLVFVLMRI